MKVWAWGDFSANTTNYVTEEEIWEAYVDDIAPRHPWPGPDETRTSALRQLQSPLVQRLLNVYAKPIDNIDAIKRAINYRDRQTCEVAKLKRRLHDLELENAWDKYDSNHFRPNDDLLHLLGIEDFTFTNEADVRFYGAYLATGRTERRQVAERVYQRAIQDLKNGPQED